MLLSVTEVVSDTNTACGEQSVDRKSEWPTQHFLARDSFLTNSFVTGGEILEGLQSQLERYGSYLSSEIMQVARVHRFDVNAN